MTTKFNTLYEQIIEEKEYQLFCEQLDEDFAHKAISAVGDVERLIKSGWKKLFGKEKQPKRSMQELADWLRKNEEVIEAAKQYDDGGTTRDFNTLVDTIVDKTQDIPELSDKQKQLQNKVNTLKNDSKLQKAFKIIFTKQYVKNKTLEDRLAYAYLVLFGSMTLDD